MDWSGGFLGVGGGEIEKRRVELYTGGGRVSAQALYALAAAAAVATLCVREREREKPRLHYTLT